LEAGKGVGWGVFGDWSGFQVGSNLFRV